MSIPLLSCHVYQRIAPSSTLPSVFDLRLPLSPSSPPLPLNPCPSPRPPFFSHPFTPWPPSPSSPPNRALRASPLTSLKTKSTQRRFPASPFTSSNADRPQRLIQRIIHRLLRCWIYRINCMLYYLGGIRAESVRRADVPLGEGLAGYADAGGAGETKGDVKGFLTMMGVCVGSGMRRGTHG